MKGNDLSGANGFTLVEIMIVVVIIGILATLGLPAFQQVRMHSQNTTTINDLRTFRAAFDTFALEKGYWPPDSMGNAWPDAATAAEVYDGYIKQTQWEKTTPIGGNYDWDPDQFFNSNGVSVDAYTVSDDQVALLDKMVDDGDLTTGLFRQRGGGVIWIMDFNN
jgi:prepilin-type N-terminal cleavage/methylation domain-containing protein